MTAAAARRAPMPSSPAPWLVPALHIALAVAYPFLAHFASLYDSGTLAACAVGTVVLMALAEGLVLRRAWAWIALMLAVAALAWLAQSRFAQLPLLLVPVGFVSMVVWIFGRTLLPGRTPLITRIVAALECCTPARLEPALHRYTRRLTLAWALVLGVLAICNLALAAFVVPGGLLATAGYPPVVGVSEAQWSWFANWLNYGLIGGFFVLEYLYRKRRFPGRYRNAADFAQRMAKLGPVFWRDLFRDG